jgi:hypothetical protein
LQSATYATALANLSRERQEPEIMRTARMFYAQALKQTQDALQSSEVKSDGTLASVLVLSLFDVIALDGQMSTSSWNAHMDGAASLLDIRGVDLLKTQVGLQLYFQVSNNIRVGCLQRAMPLPPRFVEFDKQASPFLDFSHPIVKFSMTVVYAFVELQVMLKNKDQYGSMDLIRQSLEVERMAVDVVDSLDTPWLYEIVEPEDAPTEAFCKTAHRYSDHVVPRFLNTVRMTRLFCQEVIWEQASIMEAETLIAHQDSVIWQCMQDAALEKARECAIEVLATVPQFIQKPESERKKLPLRATTVSGWVWPLSAVARSELLPIEVRKYAIGALHTIGNEAKLSQVVKVADMLEEGKVPLTW